MEAPGLKPQAHFFVGLALLGFRGKGLGTRVEALGNGNEGLGFRQTSVQDLLAMTEKQMQAHLFSKGLLRASGSGCRPQRRMARLQISGHYAYPAVRSDLTLAPHFCPRATAAGSLH